MQKLRYEGSDISYDDNIEIKMSEAKKGTVVNLTRNDEDEIYRQGKDFIRDLEDKVFSKRALYKQKAPSARHSGLRPLMVSILSLIHKASRIAKQKHKDFYGLTLYECQKAMKMCNVSNHTVRDNLRKLVKLDLVEKKFVHIDGKNRRDTFFDLKLSDKAVPCKDGAYIIFNEEYGSKGLFILNCPEYPYCSLRRKDCRIAHHLKTLANMLPNYIKSMEGEEMEIPDIPRPESLETTSSSAASIVNRLNDANKPYTELT
jgi:hypothetical protein